MQTVLHPLLNSVLREMPRHIYESPKADDEWSQSALSACDDVTLIEAVIDVIAQPKLAAPSSFALHAPLDLLARGRLLPWVDVSARDLARRRIAEIATRYAASGEEIIAAPCRFLNDECTITALKTAMITGDATAAHNAVNFLASATSVANDVSVERANDIRRALMDWVVPQLGAAGHAPILFAALPWAARTLANAMRLLCAPVYYLARSSAGQMDWLDSSAFANVPLGSTSTEVQGGNDPVHALWCALRAPSAIKAPSSSIAPTLLASQSQMVADRAFVRACASITAADAERVILRTAALSMLHDDPDEAPYGWTHCLTLPQAVLQNRDVASDHRTVVAMAASYVYAFRSTLGSTALVDEQLAAVSTDLEPISVKNSHEQIYQLATNAAIHRDAHLAKYTLACFDAVATDPTAHTLYVSAAQRLYDLWAKRASARARTA